MGGKRGTEKGVEMAILREGIKMMYGGCSFLRDRDIKMMYGGILKRCIPHLILMYVPPSF